MPVITIDGRKLETLPGKTIIEAALDNGITIPHFCWHPSLSVAGNCRMCLVRVGSPKKNTDGSVELDEAGNPVVMWIPKLQIACATPIADGMIVDTSGEKTQNATDAVMEFLLINHPLDCPICDEAGQCKLQEYAYKYSKGESRFDESKNHKDKRVQWGPQVMFDGERCISCSRCIRFATEYAEQPVISFVQRGDHVTIETFEGTQFDSPYSMNVIELCPVGALTSIDFRFKARVWDMSFNDSICPGCARGCNIQIGVRDNTVLRLEPRANPFVNQFWMCDDGRLRQYKWINENRLSGASHQTQSSGTVLAPLSWTDAYSAAAKGLQTVPASNVLVLLSGKSTNEDAYLAIKLTSNILKGSTVAQTVCVDPQFADSKLRIADRNANSQGMDAIGITNSMTSQEVVSSINNGKTKAIILIGDDYCSDTSFVMALQKLSFLVLASSNQNNAVEAASILFASSTYAEIEGTYTNIDKRVQHFTPAVVTTDNLRTMGMKMSRLDKFGAHNDRWTQGERRESKPNWKIIQGIANALGAGWLYTKSEEIFDEISLKVSCFSSMSYQILDEHHGATIGKGHQLDHVGVVYESHFMKPN